MVSALKMRFNRLSFITGLITFLFLNVFHTAASAQIFKRKIRVNGRLLKVKELNVQINRILDSASLPGLSFAVIDHDMVVFFHTYGYKEFKKSADGKMKGVGAVNKRTLFEACSLSKSYFAFAVQELVDRGMLNLDTPLCAYLPYPKLQHDERYKKITGRMALSHSSGLENWQRENDSTKLEILEEPGTKYNYSGEGYIYLSKVVESLLKKPTSAYMNELVYQPLKLRNTFSTFPDDGNGRSLKNFSVGHDSFLRSYPKDKNQTPNIAAMIHTTAKDYAKLLISFFNHKHLSQNRFDDLTRSGIFVNENNKWGPGFAVCFQNGDTILYQPGDNGKFRGMGCYSLQKKTGFVMFVNGERGDKIGGALDSLTVKLDLFDRERQYPNFTFKVLKVYNDSGYVAASVFFRNAVSDKKQVKSEDSFGGLIQLFFWNEPDFSAEISDEYKLQYPASTKAYVWAGKIKMKKGLFGEAINNFKKVILLDHNETYDMEKLITECNEELKSKNQQ